MKISYLGTGAAEGFPAMFCNCKYCRDIRKTHPRFARTRSQVALDDVLVIDFPPETYTHSLFGGLDLSKVRYALITHSHMDHFYAHDFILRGYKYAELEEDVLDIYGNEEVAKVFAECTAREMKATVAPHISFNVVHALSELSLGDFRVLTLPAMHGTAEEALLYYVERNGKGYLHLHDTSDLSAEAIAYLKEKGAKADAASYDCTFLEAETLEGARHMGLSRVCEVREKLQKAGIVSDGTRHVITHFSHNCNPSPEKLEGITAKYGFIAAYDGMTLEV